MIDAQTGGQLMRYIMVGVASNSFLYLAYLGLTVVGFGHKTAMTFLYITGGLISFVVNRAWSFKHKGRGRSAFARYSVTYIFGYLFNLALLWLFVDRLHQPHQFVQAVAIVLVAVSLFLMNKFWVFAPLATRDNVG